MKPFTLALASLFAFALPALAAPHQANGIKIGEVSSDSAIVWTRLTAGEPWVKAPATPPHKSLKEGSPEMKEAIEAWSVPGSPGEVRVTYRPENTKVKKLSTDWRAVVPDDDHTVQFTLTGLRPATRYAILSEARAPGGGDTIASTVEGGFRTAPAADSPASVAFTVVTGQGYHRRDDADNGHRIYPVMLKDVDPDFFVNTGDIIYYDKAVPQAKNAELARMKWQRMYALPFQREFHNQVASYFIKDDHDTLDNDSWPGRSYGDLTWEQGLKIFPEQVPMGDSTYRTRRWGKDLQVWLVEGRDFRSPNNMPDGPDKTIWGEEQMQWLKDSIKASDATFRILISPTPIVGPDRTSKNDNHANKGFTHEGDRVRAFLAKQKNLFVICGDRHWQYVSVDPKTGVREYSCGPTSDKHASGFSEKNRNEMHRYLKVKGGFLSVTIERDGDQPRAVFRHHAVDGSVYNEDTQVAQ